jgi:hypothetical protein
MLLEPESFMRNDLCEMSYTTELMYAIHLDAPLGEQLMSTDMIDALRRISGQLFSDAIKLYGYPE